MNNCLVTKLKAEVQNDELNYLGMMKIKATATKDSAGFVVGVTWNKTLDIKSKTPVSLYKYSNSGMGDALATNVTSYTWTNSDNNYQLLFISVPNDGVEHIYYVSKYNITNIMSNNAYSTNLGVNLIFDAEEILYSGRLVNVWAKLEGTIKELPTTSLNRLFIGNSGTSTIGDLTSTFNKNAIAYFSINDSAIGLDLDQLNGDCGKNLVQAYMTSNRNVKGDLYNWLQRIHDAGKVSGTSSINIGSTNATYNGQAPKVENYVVTFTSDGFTVK